MAISQGKSRRKSTGGRLRSARKKRKSELGRKLLQPVVGKEKVKMIRTQGRNVKARALVAEMANVLNPDTKESKKSKIIGVAENTANPHFVRRNIITKGAVIITELGNAKVTSRPGQDGIVNAVLVK